jgi:hypothetical protein
MEQTGNIKLAKEVYYERMFYPARLKFNIL